MFFYSSIFVMNVTNAILYKFVSFVFLECGGNQLLL